MKIRYGSGRVVLFLGGFAIKICRLTPLWNLIFDLWWLIKRGNFKYIPRAVKNKWRFINKGIKQNVNEFKCWESCKAPFLVPTYFTLGLINVQKAEYGEVPNIIEMAQLCNLIESKTDTQFNELDAHCLSPDNFLRNEQGYKIVDYGDGSSREVLFPLFIIKWQKELTAILCRQKN